MVNSKQNLYKVEYSSELFEIAKGDLQTAEALIKVENPGRVENILYMIQQSVEKALKAVLIKKRISFPLVHDLGILIALLPTDLYPPGGFDLSALNPYASIRRYEEGPIPITKEEVSSSFEAAKLVLQWAENNLKEKE